MIKIISGSLSESKKTALFHAVSVLQINAEIICVSARSEVSAIPQGLEETYLGASNRAKNSLLYPGADYYLGTESGLIIFTPELPPVDIAVSVLRTRTEIVAVGTSQGLMYPMEEYKKAKELAIKTGQDPLRQKGSIITTGNPSDPHFEITKGRASRADCLYSGMWATLVHIASSQKFQSSRINSAGV